MAHGVSAVLQAGSANEPSRLGKTELCTRMCTCNGCGQARAVRRFVFVCAPCMYHSAWNKAGVCGLAGCCLLVHSKHDTCPLWSCVLPLCSSWLDVQGGGLGIMLITVLRRHMLCMARNMTARVRWQAWVAVCVGCLLSVCEQDDCTSPWGCPMLSFSVSCLQHDSCHQCCVDVLQCVSHSF